MTREILDLARSLGISPGLSPGEILAEARRFLARSSDDTQREIVARYLRAAILSIREGRKWKSQTE